VRLLTVTVATKGIRKGAYTRRMQVPSLRTDGVPRAQEAAAAARDRRAALSARLAGGPALIPAGRPRPRNYPANQYPFRASSHFLYFVGQSLPEAALWLDGDEQRLLLPEEDPLDVLWHGPGEAAAELGARSGLRVGRLKELPALAQGRQVATPPLALAEDRSLFGRLLGRAPETLGSAEEPDAALLEAIIALRLRHDGAALRELQRAATLSVEGHLAGMRATRPGLRESAVRAAMEAVFAREGCGTAYPSIVTRRGEVLHERRHDGVLAAGDLLLADVGAESEGGYAADITRVWPASGRFSPSQRALYLVVLEAQRAALEQVRPGARFRDVHLAAVRTLSEGLVALGILRGRPDQLVERGVHALFMPHGVGHLLGLDVHDMEDLGDRAGYAPGRARAVQFGLSYLRLDRDLAPGMVVTIEPGFYRIPALLERPEQVGLDLLDVDRARLSEFGDVRGIRIEDDVLVTEQGHEVLTAALPKQPDAVEAVMAEGAAGAG
jgi:Xaa-Pro aminopeptidase